MALIDRTQDDAPVEIGSGDDTTSAKALTVLAKFGVDAWRKWCQEEETE